MRSRRDFLKRLLALVLLPAGLAARAAGAAPGPGFRLVNGWVLSDRDVAALAALDRARR
jgi:hypothetical protein